MASKLELMWLNKEQNLSVEPRILIERHELSYKHDHISLLQDQKATFDNLLIHGDNLLGLKALEPSFAGKIKCVYIDPPYNTGSAFEHYDDNVEHSVYLSLMKPRLESIRKLLMDEGSLWISIDDDEQAYLKVLCDEVFGRNNFVATCIWQKKHTRANDAKWFSDNHDFILVYAKNKERWHPYLLPRTEENVSGYSNPDNDPRGPWQSLPLQARSGTDPNFEHTFSNGVVWHPPVGRYSAFSHESLQEMEKDNRIWFGANGQNIPRYKKFLSEVKDGLVPTTIWLRDEVGDNQEAKTEAKILSPLDVFSTPKPERLIHKILTLATKPGDIVLDSFLGSGTTIAVAHKMHRRWIGIEMMPTAYSHCKTRMDLIIDGKDKGGITELVNWTDGGGYKFYELAPTLINEDAFGQAVINKEYNSDMLAAAVAIHEGFKYEPDNDCYWKQSKNDNNTYLYVTTNHINENIVNGIKTEMKDDEFLVIVCKSYDEALKHYSKNITIKKIPQSLLKNCEFGVDNYSLNIVCPPEYEYEEDDE